MKPYSMFFAIVLSNLVPTLALSEDFRVERSIPLASSPEDAWHVAGDFCDIDDWHPAISSCDLKVIDGSLHRELTTTDGGVFVEKRIAVEPGLSYTYAIVSSPWPIEGYTGTLSMTRGDPATLSWSSRFSSDDPGAEALVGGAYEAGLAELSTLLSE